MKDFFEGLLTIKEGESEMKNIFLRVKKCIIEEANFELIAPYTEEKVLRALKEMGPTKASRIDGLLIIFFQKCWHIMGKEVSLFCLVILNNDMNLEAMNVTNIVLIPKIQYPMTMGNFRPISICNVIYKVIVKMVANHF